MLPEDICDTLVKSVFSRLFIQDTTYARLLLSLLESGITICGVAIFFFL